MECLDKMQCLDSNRLDKMQCLDSNRLDKMQCLDSNRLDKMQCRDNLAELWRQSMFQYKMITSHPLAV
jgi:hypothetical protein